MKWPESLTLIRHAESAYNNQKAIKEQDPLFKKFKKAYNKNPESAESRELALEMIANYPVRVGDHDTPLAPDDSFKAKRVGVSLKDLIKLPDVIFVSPYQRTHETLKGITEGWPELTDVKTYEEERIREQEHGLALLYWDWRVFNVIHPEQRKLRDIEGSYWYRYPQGENVPDVRERLRSWTTTITRDFQEKNVLSVTHHLSILAMRANLERLDASEFERLDENEKPINLGVTTYLGEPNQGRDGRLLLASYNQRLY